MAYDGSITLISGIKQANNGTFPLVDAPAVRVTDDKRLDEALNEKQNAPANAGTAGQVLGLNNNLAPVWMDQSSGSVIDDTAGPGDTDVTWSADKISGEISDVEEIVDNVVAVQDTTPTEPGTRIWLPATAQDPVQVPTYEEFTALGLSVVDGKLCATYEEV